MKKKKVRKRGDTSIRVSQELHGKLDKMRKLLKKKKRYETFEELLQRMLKEAKERDLEARLKAKA